MTLPFFDAFDYPNGSDDPNWGEQRGDWVVRNGEYGIQDTDGWWRFSMVNDVFPADFVMKYDHIGLHMTPGGHIGGCILRAQGAGGTPWHGSLLFVTSNTSWTVHKIKEDGGWQAGWPGAGGGWSHGVNEGETAHIEVTFVGNVFEVKAETDTGATFEATHDFTDDGGIWTSGQVGLAISWDWTELYDRFDNVVVYEAGDTRPGIVTGTVTDSVSGLPVEGAVVDIIDTSLTTTTQSDGTYALTDVPLTAKYLYVHTVGYVPKKIRMNVAPAIPTIMNVKLEEFVGLDWARGASASTSSKSGVASAINDGNAETSWTPDEGLSYGEWAQLSWEGPLTISTILVDMVGPTQDYSIQSSLDGTTWTEVTQVTSSETDHTHWIETVVLPSPLTLRYLRLVNNWFGFESFIDIYSIECYKANGSVAGVVKNSSGQPVQGAEVYVTESINGQRGPSRLPMKTTTLADGSYSIAVPEGPVMVTAAAADSMTVSSAPVSVTEGSQTSVPELIVTHVTEGGSIFSDNFDDLAPFETNPRWDMLSGTWYGLDGRYQVGPEAMSLATVAGIAPRNCVADVDTNGFESGIVARWQDMDNFLLLVYSAGRQFYWHEHINGEWPVSGLIQPAVDEKAIHYRAVVVGNKAQGMISDGFNTYWTPVITLSDLLSPGKVGLFKNNMPSGMSIDDRSFDNFTVQSGSSALPPPVGPSGAKANGPGWYGAVNGIVTAVFSDYNYFVVEAEDRSSAIIVKPIPAQVPAIGDEVIILGVMRTDGAFGLIELSSAGGNNELGPLGVNNRNLTGAVGNPGVSNLDLLVTTYGQVVDEPIVFSDGSTRFHITDGSAIPNGPTVTVPAAPTIYTENFDSYNNGDDPVGWEEWAGDWWVQDGQYAPREGAVIWHFSVLNSTPLLTDYVLEYDQIGVYDTTHSGALLRMDSISLPMSWNHYLRTTLSDVNFGSIIGNAYGGHAWTGTPSETDVVHVRIESNGMVFTASLNQDVTGATWTGSWDHTGKNLPESGYIGFAGGGPGDGRWAWDNLRLTYAGNAQIAADAVQVVIPASVTNAPTISKDDYIQAVGIAGKGIAIGADIRSVMIRRDSDLTIPPR
ncbi:MAG: carboxypeptidase regulatory-like domain-containing protein [Armatimonadetes bacterium]|nr:carboxypeptidase regulatory-like domain-containing protein [Armatimonadota bacterium]